MRVGLTKDCQAKVGIKVALELDVGTVVDIQRRLDAQRLCLLERDVEELGEDTEAFVRS